MRLVKTEIAHMCWHCVTTVNRRCICLSFLQGCMGYETSLCSLGHWTDWPCRLECGGSLALGLEICCCRSLLSQNSPWLSLRPPCILQSFFFPLCIFIWRGSVMLVILKKQTKDLPTKQFLNKLNTYQLYFINVSVQGSTSPLCTFVLLVE